MLTAIIITGALIGWFCLGYNVYTFVVWALKDSRELDPD